MHRMHKCPAIYRIFKLTFTKQNVFKIHPYVAWLDKSSFIFISEHYSIVWIYCSSFIRSSIEGQLGCFHLLVIVSKVVNNNCLKILCGQSRPYDEIIFRFIVQLSSVGQSCPTLCYPHGLQQARPPCPSPNARAHSNSCPFSWWCHLTISSSAIPFSSHLQSSLALGSFPMSQFLASCDQSIGVSASKSVLPMNIQDWSPLGWTGWISLLLQGLLRAFSKTTVQKHQLPGTSFLYNPTLTSIHDY